MNIPHSPIYFDLDGTLVDSLADIAGAANAVRKAFGKQELALDVVRGFVGDGVEKLLSRSLETADRDLIDRALQVWRNHYEHHCLDETVFYDGVRELLDRLLELQIPMAVISNKPESFCRKIIQGLDGLHYFQLILGGDSTAKRKPEPDPIYHAQEVMKIGQGAGLMVGDSDNDIRCAQSAGVGSCGVLWGIGEVEKLKRSHPDHLIENPMELLTIPLIKKWIHE